MNTTHYVLLGLVTILIFFTPSTGGATSAAPALIAHWPFEGNCSDASGNGHHGTCVGDPLFSPGPLGQGLCLGEDKYVEVPDTPPGLDDEMTQLTIDLWLKLESHPTYQAGVVAKWGPGSHPDDSYILGLTASGHLAFTVTDGRGSPDVGYTSRSTHDPLPEDNVWRRITATWEAPNDMHIYVAGQDEPLDSLCTTCGDDAQQVQDTEQVLWVGNHEHSGSLGGWLHGCVDEIKIYEGIIGPPFGVGGIAELPDVAGAPLKARDSSGGNAGLLAGITAAAAGVIALGSAAWYARRRWLHQRM